MIIFAVNQQRDSERKYSSKTILIPPHIESKHPVYAAITEPKYAREISPPPKFPNLWCEGDDVICLNTVTSTPTEIMGKLIAALPTDKRNRFKIRLSVEKLEDREPDSQPTESPN